MTKYKSQPWDLSDLVSNSNGNEIKKKIDVIQKKSTEFEKIKSELQPNIKVKEFKKILDQIEDISEKTSKVLGFASLQYAADTQSDEATSFLTKMSKIGSEISNKMLFFDLWWKKSLDEKNAQRLIKESGELSDYLRYKRMVAKFSLTEPEEKIINTLDVTGASALVKLYDKITNSFIYELKIKDKKKKLTREQLSVFLKNPDPNMRKLAYRSLFSKFEFSKGVLGEIYQNIVLNWRDEGIEIRGYSSPISIQNIGNDVDEKTVKSLLEVCKNNAPIFQKFFRLKSNILKTKKLRRYDLYAPITQSKEKNYSYEKAVKLVLESLYKFSPILSSMAKKVFDENHIDSSIRQGKRDGAFCSTIAPKITPYVLTNFTGKTRDVFTLAHELGHAIHSQTASEKSILVSEAPLPLAETASTFSELLLYDNMSEKVSSNEKKLMVSGKIDDLYATIMRQSFFTLFEISAHDSISNGTTVDELSKTYLHNLKEQFGNSLEISADFGLEWSCIPHFFHSPFYCYSYSFGNLLALSLFYRYKKEGKDFVSSYINILSAGGSKKPEDLLEEYGFDIGSKKFWQDGFEIISNQVNEFSKLI